MLELLKGKVTPRDWAFVGIVLSIGALLCVGFYFGVYQKQLETLKTKETELVTAQASLAKAQELAVKYKEQEAIAGKMQQLVDLFQKRLPNASEIPALVQKFESLGARAGIKPQLSQLPIETKAPKETIPYQVTAEGNFHQIVQFINLLERDERYLKISDLDIQEEKGGISKATFTLSTYRFLQTEPQPAQASPAAAPAGAKS